MTGTLGFNGERMEQARIARGMTAIALAELLGVASSNITLYEHGKQSPSSEVMDKIVSKLNMPRDFFLKESPTQDTERIYCRSMSSATKSARMRVQVRFLWLREITTYLRRYLDLPAVNIPDFKVPQDPKDISMAMVEELAKECRNFYRLGDGPISDTVSLLENNGVIVTRGEVGAETLDAISQCPSDDDRPYIFLGTDKGSAVRSRFDIAHEFGHVIMHRRCDPGVSRNTHIHSLMEKQSHYFASCFLLPENGFSRELYAPSLDGFASLKPRWRVSIAMMIKRTEDLGIINEEQARRMWINLSRRGWRKEEPLDQKLLPERPRVLRRCIEILIESGTKTKAQLVSDLRLPEPDIQSLTGLPGGFFNDDAMADPKLKPLAYSPGVIPFRSR